MGKKSRAKRQNREANADRSLTPPSRDVARPGSEEEGRDSSPARVRGAERGGEHLEVHVGPLPAPWVLRQYDDVVPGLAKRIVNQWEGETKHRRRMERRGSFLSLLDLLASHGLEYFGRLMAAVITGGLLWTSIAFMRKGHPVSGAAILTGTLVGVVALFIVGAKKSGHGASDR